MEYILHDSTIDKTLEAANPSHQISVCTYIQVFQLDALTKFVVSREVVMTQEEESELRLQIEDYSQLYANTTVKKTAADKTVRLITSNTTEVKESAFETIKRRGNSRDDYDTLTTHVKRISHLYKMKQDVPKVVLELDSVLEKHSAWLQKSRMLLEENSQRGISFIRSRA